MQGANKFMIDALSIYTNSLYISHTSLPYVPAQIVNIV